MVVALEKQQRLLQQQAVLHTVLDVASREAVAFAWKMGWEAVTLGSWIVSGAG
jgi:hypothetical protein